MTSHEEADTSDGGDRSPGTCSRRGFLHIGLGLPLTVAATAAALPACTSGDPAPAADMLFLRDGDIALFQALLPVVAVDLMELAPSAREARISRTVHQIDQACAAMNLHGRDELRRLFGLLSVPALRWISAGVGTEWQEASPQRIGAFVDRWRTSRLETLNAGGNVLVKLCSTNYYALPEARSVTGYPGPPPSIALAVNS